MYVWGSLRSPDFISCTWDIIKSCDYMLVSNKLLFSVFWPKNSGMWLVSLQSGDTKIYVIAARTSEQGKVVGRSCTCIDLFWENLPNGVKILCTGCC